MSYNIAVPFNRILEAFDLGGDLNFWKDAEESDIVYEKLDSFETTGIKISYTVPTGKILTISSILLEPANTSSLHCYASIKFADLIAGTVYALITLDILNRVGAVSFNYIRNPENTRSYLYGRQFHGDGIRKLEIDVSNISGLFHVRMLGVLKSAVTHYPSQVSKITSQPLTADRIKLIFDAPEDNGGSPITGYAIDRKKSEDSNFLTVNTFNSLPSQESDIEYTDGETTSLDDNQSYDYRVSAINVMGRGTPSKTVTSTTEIDFPASVTSLAVTSLNSTQLKLTFVLPTDTGGVPLQGVKIERSLQETSGFSDIISDTGNLKHRIHRHRS